MEENKETVNVALMQLVVDYLANPLDNRTVKQFSEESSISESTYYRFRKDNFQAIGTAVNDARAKFMPLLRATAYKHLSTRLARSDAALKLFFQLAGDLVERTESKFTMMTPDEKRKQIQDLMATLSASMVNKVNDNKGNSSNEQTGTR